MPTDKTYEAPPAMPTGKMVTVQPGADPTFDATKVNPQKAAIQGNMTQDFGTKRRSFGVNQGDQ